MTSKNKKKLNKQDRFENIVKGLKKKVFLIMSGILFLNFLLYFQTRNFDFVDYDDPTYVINNKDVRDLSFSGVYKMFFDPYKPEEIKPPLTVFTLAINYSISEFNPASYHILNMLFHLANIILVFYLARKLGLNEFASLAVAFFFSIHPFNVESVAWVTARKEVQYTFFFLTALLAYLHFLDKRIWWQYLLAFILFVCAFYSKYSAVTFPLVILAAALIWKQRKDYLKTVAEVVPFFILPLYITINSFAVVFEESGADMQQSEMEAPLFEDIPAKGITDYYDFTLKDKIILGGYSFVSYLEKYVFPRNLRLIYPYPQLSEGQFSSIYYILFFLSLIIVALAVYLIVYFNIWQNKTAMFGLFFFLSGLSILLHVLPIGGRVVIAERYMYLPQVGLLIFIFSLSSHLIYSKLYRFRYYAILSVFAVYFVFQTHARIPVWENSYELFTDLIEKEPDYAVSYNNLASWYVLNNQINNAAELLKKAIEISPTYPLPYFNLGKIASMQDNDQLAVQLYRKAIELDPFYSSAYNNIGTIYLNSEQFDSAIVYLNKALDINAQLHLPNFNLGVVYDELMKYEKAINYFKIAANLNENPYIEYNNIGNIYIKMDEDHAAEAYLLKSIELNPSYYLSYYNLGFLYELNDDFERAKINYKKSVELNPNQTGPYLSLANIYKEAGDKQTANFYLSKIEDAPIDSDFENRIDLAVSYELEGNMVAANQIYKQLVAELPDNPELYIRLGFTYKRMGEVDAALSALNQSIRLDPANASAYQNKAMALLRLEGNEFAAIENFDKALSLDNSLGDAYVNRGTAYIKMGNFQKGVEDLTKGIEILGDEVALNMYINRGIANLNLGNQEEACKDFNTALEKGYQNAILFVRDHCE
ncbi:MAG: tetratricopeptide repeat protein [Chitinophagaceae bacterium]|nr:MAG: tetratricopeptide repeat protein [Chitinophagaceae bacterium]